MGHADDDHCRLAHSSLAGVGTPSTVSTCSASCAAAEIMLEIVEFERELREHLSTHAASSSSATALPVAALARIAPSEDRLHLVEEQDARSASCDDAEGPIACV